MLPGLGRIDPPLLPMVARVIDSPQPIEAPPVSAADRADLTATPLPEIPLAANTAGYTAPPPPTPEELARQRQLSGWRVLECTARGGEHHAARN